MSNFPERSEGTIPSDIQKCQGTCAVKAISVEPRIACTIVATNGIYAGGVVLTLVCIGFALINIWKMGGLAILKRSLYLNAHQCYQIDVFLSQNSIR